VPGLIMIGWWQGFPYWTTVAVCVIGGTLGVMYSVPLRRALVTGSDLPFPEGVAAAEVLKAGEESEEGAAGNAKSLRAIVLGSLAAAGFSLLAALKVIGNEISVAFRVGSGGSLFGAERRVRLRRRPRGRRQRAGRPAGRADLRAGQWGCSGGA
jgi:putative OPT family oligopeptide transporter